LSYSAYADGARLPWSIQMPDPKLGIPFAFLLALGAADAGAAASSLTDTADLLQPGSLRNLLDQDNQRQVGDIARERTDPKATGRTTQWFNGSFNSCFQGYWRRC
jgi:hypothetical protein